MDRGRVGRAESQGGDDGPGAHQGGADGTGAHQGGADGTGAHQGGADGTGAHQGGADGTGAHQGRADGTGAHQGGADGTGAHQGGADGTLNQGRDWDLGNTETHETNSPHSRRFLGGSAFKSPNPRDCHIRFGRKFYCQSADPEWTHVGSVDADAPLL